MVPMLTAVNAVLMQDTVSQPCWLPLSVVELSLVLISGTLWGNSLLVYFLLKQLLSPHC